MPMCSPIETDYVVVGSGIAGLTFSLLASQYGRVVLITKGSLTNSNSNLAQGGIAAALSPDDSAYLHRQDTLSTGQGLCDFQTVESIVQRSHDAISFLKQLGVAFDSDNHGNLHLGKEGAHSRNRIVHAGGDATGREIIKALVRHVHANKKINILENTFVIELLVKDGECAGLMASNRSGDPVWIQSTAVILASGGLGQLYKFTTNAPGLTGDGYSLAYRAGAVLRDMEFIQFHPTALNTNTHPFPLVSEAVRGEGATLVNSEGIRFMAQYHPEKELASRDIVSRAIYSEMQAGRKVYLDAREIRGFADRFPTIDYTCKNFGIEPATDLIPVVPAVHYTMGGILTDDRGVTSVPRLFAIGEAASSGLHGANRLASNSLLEGLVIAQRAVKALLSLEPPRRSNLVHSSNFKADYVKINTRLNSIMLQQIKELMWTNVGIVRNEDRLQLVLDRFESMLSSLSPDPSPDIHTVTTALLVTRAALWRRESRGAHFRQDFPQSSSGFLTHSIQGGNHESITCSPVFTASLN
jgi:L-aspartate oxidase